MNPIHDDKSPGPAQSPQLHSRASNPKRSKKIWVIAIAAVAVFAVIVAGIGIFGGMLPKTDMKVIDSISKTPTQEDINALDKTEVFWAYFKNASLQQKVVVTKVEGRLVNGQASPTESYIFTKTGIDYTTKKFVHAEEKHTGDKITAHVRCYDGNSYIPVREGRLDRWSSYDNRNTLYPCRFDKRADRFNDGVNTGGLTASQAQRFVGTLRNQEGLLLSRISN